MAYSIIIQRRAAPHGAVQRRAAPHGAVQRRTAPYGAVRRRRRAAPCGADGPQTGAALLRRTARSVNAP